jgi:hypothetical protein
MSDSTGRESDNSEFESARDRWLEMNGLSMDFILRGGLAADARKQKSWMEFYSANVSRLCLTCREYHEPTVNHPVCRLCRDAIHAVAPKGILFDYRGWIFTPPFICMGCGIEVCFRQWAFSRSCGSCDLSESSTRLVLPKVRHPHYGKTSMCFTGPHKKSNTRDKRDIIEAAFLSPDMRGKYPLEMHDAGYIAVREAIAIMRNVRERNRASRRKRHD